MLHAQLINMMFMTVISVNTDPDYHEPTPHERGILAEYVAAAHRLDRRFLHISGAGLLAGLEPGKKRPQMTRRVEFSRRSRSDVLVISKWFDPEGVKPLGEERVVGSNSQYAFFLRRNPEGSAVQYQVVALGADDDHKASGGAMRFCFDFVDAVRGTLCGNSSDVFSRPGLTVRSIDRIDYEGMPCLKIEYRHAPSDDTCMYPTGWIIVSPQEGWITKEHFGRRADDGPPIHGKILYESASGEFPTPSEVFITNSSGRMNFRFDSVRFEPYPESRFRLSSYGLPEGLAKARPPRSTGTVGWLVLGSGGLFSTLAVLVFLRSSRGVQKSA